MLFDRKVEFRSVSFRYRPESPPVLKQISLRVIPGKVVGIVGPPGSGKSTLTKLIQRFYIPEEGQAGSARRRRSGPSRPFLAAQPYRRGAAGEPAGQGCRAAGVR